MSYRRCSYCGLSGHNRRSCSSRPDASKERDAQYYRSSIYGRAKPSCSYCGDTQHRRPKCAKLPVDRENWYRSEESVRRAFRNKMIELGACKGVLIRQTYRGSWSIETETFKEEDWNYLLIDSINLYDVSFKGIKWVFHCKRANNLQEIDWALMPDCTLDVLDKSGQPHQMVVQPYKKVEILGAADPSIVETEIPLTWVTDRASMRLPERMEDRSKKKDW